MKELKIMEKEIARLTNECIPRDISSQMLRVLGNMLNETNRWINAINKWSDRADRYDLEEDYDEFILFVEETGQDNLIEMSYKFVELQQSLSFEMMDIIPNFDYLSDVDYEGGPGSWEEERDIVMRIQRDIREAESTISRNTC